MNKYYLAGLAGMFMFGTLAGRLTAPSTTAHIAQITSPVSSSPALSQQMSSLASGVSSAATMRRDPESAVEGYQIVKRQLNQISDQQLAGYMDKLLGAGNSTHIVNKREMASRMAEEFFNQRPALSPGQLHGAIRVALTPEAPQWSGRNLQVSGRQKIYAHVELLSQAPRGQEVFVKWEDLSNGELILFEKKNVTPGVVNNWISAIPASGWQPHHYRVTVYTFDSALKVLAEQSYQVAQVNET